MSWVLILAGCLGSHRRLRLTLQRISNAQRATGPPISPAWRFGLCLRGMASLIIETAKGISIVLGLIHMH